MSETDPAHPSGVIDAGEAAGALRGIADTERRTREALYYGGASVILIVWGIAWALGYAITQFSFRYANTAWAAITVFAIAASVLYGVVRSRGRSSRWDWRITYAFLVVQGFGLFTQWLLGHGQWREIGVFWPILAGSGYLVSGLWLGRFFVLCGGAVILLSLAGYVWSGPWFGLWMAVCGGGSLILGGVWLRRIGVRG